jgi:hypothetical protein
MHQNYCIIDMLHQTHATLIEASKTHNKRNWIEDHTTSCSMNWCGVWIDRLDSRHASHQWESSILLHRPSNCLLRKAQTKGNAHRTHQWQLTSEFRYAVCNQKEISLSVITITHKNSITGIMCRRPTGWWFMQKQRIQRDNCMRQKFIWYLHHPIHRNRSNSTEA